MIKIALVFLLIYYCISNKIGGLAESNGAILVPIVERKTITVKDQPINTSKDQEIIVEHQPIPHKIFIEEEEEEERPPVAIIKERESYFQQPDRMRIHHQTTTAVNPESSTFNHGPYPRANGAPILVHLVAPNVRRKHDNGIPDLLAVLAPLAAIPLIGSLAVSSFTTMLTLTGLGRRRRRKRDINNTIHDKVLNFLNTNYSIAFNQDNPANNGKYHNLFTENDNSTTSNDQHRPFSMNAINHNQTMSELFQLDIVQQYLRQSGRPDHNDEIIASYLACRGMFLPDNKCLERLACHYADIHNGRLRPLERDVAALIIYSLLRNSHIDSAFKRRLQRAALFGYDHTASALSSGGSTSESDQTPISFVPVCDREFACPRSVVP